MLVCLSVGPSVRSNENEFDKAFSALEAISNDTPSARSSVYGLVTAPAQKHTTDDAVYTRVELIRFWAKFSKCNGTKVLYYLKC